MTLLANPLKKMRLTQPFGVDWTGVNLYARLGMKGHNGIDLSASNGTEAYAAMGGTCYIDVESPVGQPIPGYTSGYGIDIRIRSKELGLEIVYGHLQNTLVKNGEEVAAGQPIALCDNTGLSNGSHLHFGVRRIHWKEDGSGPYYDAYDNGFFGYIDPIPLMSPDAFKLPVDLGYGVRRTMTDFDWYKANLFFWNEMAKVEGKRRLMTQREKMAFVHGCWDFRAVVNPAMFDIWSQMTKPQAIKLGIIKA